MQPRETALVGVMAALTAVGAQVSVPIGQVPVTLQVLFVLLSGLMLGPRLGFLALLVYDVAGALGLPVFAGLTGGLGQIYGPLGGYIVAFPLAAFLAGLSREKGRWTMLTLSLAAVGLIYLLGWARLSVIIGPEKALTVGVLPFIPFDVAKAIIAVIVAEKIGRAGLIPLPHR
ncbi:MAG: biotin transporter BioY [Thermococci archaeon]|nr:biotin transporter BioY [Thermococci archaeon]